MKARTLALIALLLLPVSVSAQTLPATIPIFPLPEVVLFPGVARPLLIFEPRYRAMVADALKGDRVIGMVMLRPGFEANYEGRPPIYPIGCAGRITQAQQLEDGRYVIELQGLSKFRVASEDQSRPYRLARVDPIADLAPVRETTDLSALRLRLETLLNASDPLDPDLISLPDETFVNTVAQNLAMEPAERQNLLEILGAASRAQALIAWLEGRVAPAR
jgi:Lon protease-like protein